MHFYRESNLHFSNSIRVDSLERLIVDMKFSSFLVLKFWGAVDKHAILDY